MITNCGGDPFQIYGLEERDFFFNVGVLMLVVIPAAIGYALWRIFVTNRTGLRGTTILGLDENSVTHPKLYDHGISWRTLFLYGLTGFVFAVEVFRYLVDLLSA